jgi:hypothetical protein
MNMSTTNDYEGRNSPLVKRMKLSKAVKIPLALATAVASLFMVVHYVFLWNLMLGGRLA